MIMSLRPTAKHAAGVCAAVVLAVALPGHMFAEGPQPAKGVKYAQMDAAGMKEWLTYLSSDELQGRQVFTEGYGLAASYVAEHLKTWGLKPLGADNTFFENVTLKGYRVTRNSTVTVTAGGKTTTFKHGSHVTFPFASGGKQTVTFTGAEFVGYGQPADYTDRNVRDKLVVWVPNLGAAAAGAPAARNTGGGPAINTRGAKAAIGFAPAPSPSAAEQALAQAQDALQKAADTVRQAQTQAAGRGRGAAGRGAATPPDLTTVTNVALPQPPQITGDDEFFDALFAGAPVTFADIKAKAQKGEPIEPFSLQTSVSVTIDNTYDIVSEQRTRNVAAMIEGTDPRLKETYVLFGAHLDHIGYSQTGGGNPPSPTGCRQRSETAQASVRAAGKTVQNPGRGRGAPAASPAPAPQPAAQVPFDQRDMINNGADDDGSGSTALLAIAKAFATGPKPRRSVVFLWHTGEEAGLYGSRYNADFPVVPLEKVQAQLNIDMIGRDDCDNIEGDYRNTLFVVGADRISTDLHNLVVETNQSMVNPLTLDYELNDPADPESVYTRSDHYSYAAKGIPIAFFTTGLHPDYHRVSDTIDKIGFPKMARIAQLVYETGFSIASGDGVLARDNKGPRTGFGAKAEVLK
ncbi:MAG TPA: M28 family peptidase [Vicinamibacterales bacterium]|jgi:hypothetical protein|nr:M28 family peptidase [Vicinamibacterales bacterium]